MLVFKRVLDLIYKEKKMLAERKKGSAVDPRLFDTLSKLLQFAEQAAQLRHFSNRNNLTFGSSLLIKIPRARLTIVYLTHYGYLCFYSDFTKKRKSC